MSPRRGLLTKVRCRIFSATREGRAGFLCRGGDACHFGSGLCTFGRSSLCYRRRTKSHGHASHFQRPVRRSREEANMAPSTRCWAMPITRFPFSSGCCRYHMAAITPAMLRLDPVWDEIRKDPRFQELAAGKAMKYAVISVCPSSQLIQHRSGLGQVVKIQHRSSIVMKAV